MKTSNFFLATILALLGVIFESSGQTTEPTNAITNQSSFLGTSNNFDVIFRRYSNNTSINSFSGILNPFNTSFGVNSGSAYQSVFIGANAGTSYLNGGANTNNVFVGFNSGTVNTTGDSNTFIGAFSGSSNLNSKLNVFIGVNSGKNHTFGDSNVFIGENSGATIGNGADNIFIGRESGSNNSANNNLFIGASAGRFNSTGTSNTYVGFGSGQNATGSNNTFLGNLAGTVNGTGIFSGSNNTFLGSVDVTANPTMNQTIILADGQFNQRLYIHSNGFTGIDLGNHVIPQNKLEINSTGAVSATSGLRFRNFTDAIIPTSTSSKFLTVDNNGDVVLRNLPTTTTTGNFWSLNGNIVASNGSEFLGTVNDQDLVFKRNNIEAGRIGAQNTSFGKGSSALGTYNTAIGENALAANTTQGYNVAVGTQALASHILGGGNTAIGVEALSLDDTGSANTALGYGAMRNAKGGNSNIGIGNWALYKINGGYNNVSIGLSSMEKANSGNTNVAIGTESIYYNTNPVGNVVIGETTYKFSTGNYNIGLGNSTGINNTTGSYNIAIGQGASATTGNNNILIGQSAYAATGSNNILIGQSANTGGIATNALNIGNVIYGKNMGNISSVDGTSSSLGIIGIGTNNPGNTLEVKSNITDASGLRLKNLTSNSLAIANPAGAATPKVLSVDSNGDVVLVNDAGPTSTGNFWGLNGNGGTNPSTAITAPTGTSFLGTTDDKDLVFRRWNTRAGVLSNGTSQTSTLGTSLGVNSAIPEAGSVLIGNYAGFNATGGNNTYIGAGAGSSPTAALRGDNTFIGASTGSDAKGGGNVYIGRGVASALIPAGESNTLRIHNNNNSNSLIMGNFLNKTLNFNVDSINSLVTISTLNASSGNSSGTRSGLRFDDYTINTTANTSNTTSNNRFLTLNGTGDVILMNLPTVTPVTDTDDQTLALTGNVLSISEGNSVTLPAYVDTDTDDQNLSISGNQLTISEGNTVTLPTFTEVDGSVTNELQTLSQSGNTITLSNNGGSFTLPTDTDDQTLSIAGNVLTISEGNNVTLPATSVIAGTNVTVTGTGTTADPFVVNSTATGLGNCNIYSCDGTIDTSLDPIPGTRTVTLAENNLYFNTGSTNDFEKGRIYIGNNQPLVSSNMSADSDYRLYVEGGILTEKVKVALRSGTDWQDGVFAEDYKLMSLNEVDTFVKENKHLPGIESAEVLVKKGLDLGEMQAKQMGKIEELTLYVIEQNKAIEKQAKEIEELKAQVNALLNNK
jgi:trimeric autotransporter adhesin